MTKDEYELRKELIEARHELKYFDKNGWFYKLCDKFFTHVENSLKKASEK